MEWREIAAQSDERGDSLMENVIVTPFYWSASRLKKLLQCPRQFRYCYIDGIPTVPTAPLVFGQTMHEVLRWASEQHMESGALPTIEAMKRSLDQGWQAAQETAAPHFGPRHPSPEGYRMLGHQMLSAFHRHYSLRPPPLAVEMAFDLTVGTRQLVGFVDRVDEGENGLRLAARRSLDLC